MVTNKFEQTAAAARSVWMEEVHRSPKRRDVKLALKKSGDIALELIKKYSTKRRQKDARSVAAKSTREVGVQLDRSLHDHIRLMSHTALTPRRQTILQEIYQTEFTWFNVRDEDEEVCTALLKSPTTGEEGRR